MTELFWRPLTSLDLPAVEAIGAAVHPGLFEAPAVLAERLRLYPHGMHLLDADGEPGGYVISHPWRLFCPPALNSLLGTLPHDADTYYIHDLALLPGLRGSGAGGRIVRDLLVHAGREDFATASIVAVSGSQAFWERQGFSPRHRPELAAKLLSYQPQACYMVRPLP